MKTCKGSVLVSLLWCLALLSVLVVGLLYSARLDLRVVKNYGDSIQARYLAIAGIEKAKALLHQDMVERRRIGNNHAASLYNSPGEFKDVSLGRGQFSVLRSATSEEGGGFVFGIEDEESRLNVNTVSAQELGKLDQMLPETAAAIIDFRDPDNATTTGGAEADYYASLRPPYMPRNGPFQTLRELLWVRGVTRVLFWGEDANQNGLLDPEENDGAVSAPLDNQNGVLDSGWAGLMTIDSSVRNVNASGKDRVDLATADERVLTGVNGVTQEIARAIISQRDQKKFESLSDLLDLTPARPPGARNPQAGNNSVPGQPVPGQAQVQPQAQPQGGGTPQPQPNVDGQPSGPKLINVDKLVELADDLTTVSDLDLPGVVNINTANASVLVCLQGITPEIAQAILNYRQSSGFFPNTAALLKVPGMTPNIFKGMNARISARSETFRITSEGRVPSSGARKRIQMIVHVDARGVTTLSCREDL